MEEYASIYRRDGIVKVSPSSSRNEDCFPTGTEMKLLAEQVLGEFAPASILVTNENIQVLLKKNEIGMTNIIETRKVKSRIENFVCSNKTWTNLCCTGGIISTIVGEVCRNDDYDSSPWCLYKDKLNIKPAGSMGFAPHLDSPSLRVTGLCDNFVTVMIAIDDMTIENGCLQVCRGNWTGENYVPCVKISLAGSNPDGNGREGAILNDVACDLLWEYVECLSGDIFIFSGWLPHRSSCNLTQLTRRAVFLTYNHSEDGELYETYYRVMRDMRSEFLKQQYVNAATEATTNVSMFHIETKI
jgi:hypothetical protein